MDAEIVASDKIAMGLRVYLNGKDVTDSCVAVKIPSGAGWVDLVQKGADGRIALGEDGIVIKRKHGWLRFEANPKGVDDEREDRIIRGEGHTNDR